MAVSPAFNEEGMLGRLQEAVGASASVRALDLACGPGIVAAEIAPHVREVVGIDATPAMIRLARERFDTAGIANARLAVAAAEQLPFRNGEFDLVISRLSLHHFQDVPRVLLEIRRVLSSGGWLIVADVVSSPNAEESALHNSLEQLRDPTHVRMLPPAELQQVIHAAGFSLAQQQTWQQERSFKEWAEIIADPSRTGPLESVMRVLAREGLQAGISLREESGELRFTHRWMMVSAKSG